MEQLKPCPFCGVEIKHDKKLCDVSIFKSENILRTNVAIEIEVFLHSAYCDRCNYKVEFLETVMGASSPPTYETIKTKTSGSFEDFWNNRVKE